MSQTEQNEPHGRFTVKTTSDSHFSWVRTRLSVERTLMAWMRTSVSLIGFGFTIVQFFERMNDFSGVSAARFSEAPRYLGLALILCGVVAMLVSIWEYEWTLRYLRNGDFAAIASTDPSGTRVRTPLVAVAAVLSLIGTFAFFSVLFRLV